ncbi:MJ0307 family thioredoxin [Geoglobus acetivorans]|uniref:Glutaredoxin (Grx-2) n=1 Tax=Geoglobus acetivorans TaxID=565033 RepID=A0A0A7GIG2_GEOAI|nr:glutaredoxin (grx-2) [Geoglobus acetivorans]
MISIKLLTSPTCPYCPRAREVVKKLTEEDGNVIALELSVTTDEGLKEALKFGISGVPAIIINDADVILGVPKLSDLKRLVEKYRYN